MPFSSGNHSQHGTGVLKPDTGSGWNSTPSPTPHPQHQQTHPGINSSFRVPVLASGNWGSSCVACPGKASGYLFVASSGIFLGVKSADKPGNVSAEEWGGSRRWQLTLQSCEEVSTCDIYDPHFLEHRVTRYNNSYREPAVQLLKQKCPQNRCFTH